MVEDVLLEASGRTPNVFWLVTGITDKNPERLEELASGTLHGVKGISDNKKILMHWLGIGRNAVLVMPASTTMAINGGLYKIHYNDPYELLRNDMELLARVWNKEHGTSNGRRGIMNNLSDNISRLLIKDPNRTASDIGHSIYGGYVDLAKDVPEINSPGELAEFVRGRVIEKADSRRKKGLEELPLEWWKGVVGDAVVQGVKTYESEGEWVVTDETLKVPGGSKLLVAVTAKPEDFPEEVRGQLKTGDLKGFRGITQKHISSVPVIMAIYKYGLDKLYDVRFIDMNKFREVQNKLQVKHFHG